MNSMAEMPKTIEYPIVDAKGNLNVELINFRKLENHYALELEIRNIGTDNYRLFIKGACLSIILSEPRVYSKPLHVHNVNWRIYSQQSYDVLKHADIWLPGDNFYLIRHYAYPDDQLLEVIMGNMFSHEIWF